MYVASVSCRCCKSRSGCCICCNGYTSILRILQAFVPNISTVSDGCCTCFIWVLHMFTLKLQVFHPAVAYVFTHMLQVFYIDVAYVLQCPHTYFPRVSDDVASVSTISDVCCKCFL
jgi:hypothetical protein